MTSTRDGFVHLHTHTEYSMLDGAARIKDVVEIAKKDGQIGIGITDHGNMYGALEFYSACRKNDINPIIGLEAYMAKDSRFDRPQRKARSESMEDTTDGGKLYYHLTMLAENNDGYKNLMKLSSKSYLEGYYYKPRLDFELLSQYSKGIIATSGCLGGIVLQSMLAGDFEAAKSYAVTFQDIFGKDNFFIEIQDHGIDKQKLTNPHLIELAKKIGAPLLATNDSHYCTKGDSDAHDALLCVQTASLISDTNRLKFDGSEHYLKSSREMRELFGEVIEACDNTLLIAERAKVEIEFGKANLPHFKVPESFKTEDQSEAEKRYLRHLVFEGAKERYSSGLTDEVVSRLEYELSVIEEMGFSSYFLIVWDLIKFARDNKIRTGPGRGSAAGCCVAYCLRIVDIDPIKHGLFFERFLNPGRKTMPDIDMDIDDRYRSDMIKYASSVYGEDHVAQIITFSTIKARAAVRDAARVLGYPYFLGDKIAKLMPPVVMGRDTPLWACFDEVPEHNEGFKAAKELRDLYDTDDDAKRVIEVAKGLEGLCRQDGIHAAAVVISGDELTEYLPIQRKPENSQDPSQAPTITQYEMHAVEELGLLKMDFLGLKTLGVIDKALENIELISGEKIDIMSIPLDDEKTFEMLRKGNTAGVFQLESGPMKTLIRRLSPTGFDDVAALVALYRPGPMAANMHHDYADRKNGVQEITYPHPDLEELLKDTYGLMIYQESIMQVAQKFAGYSLTEADNLRKACGKKIRELIQAEREKFVAGCIKTGYGEKIGTELFNIIEPFADYAFNKSHSYGYGLIAYQTAWLKANYPEAFLSAILSSVSDDKDKTGFYLAECRDMGIIVHVPDINTSSADFTPKNYPDKEILFGLTAIRNVGEQLVDRIIKERDANGEFKDFVDFCSRVDSSVLNKRALESLIKAGAFDSMDYARQGLMVSYEKIVELVLSRRKDQENGMVSLFDESDGSDSVLDISVEIPDIEFDKRTLLNFEKEMLGRFVSDHPLLGYEEAFKSLGATPIEEFKISDDNEVISSQGSNYSTFVTVAGLVTALEKRTTKKGDQMVNLVLEDLTGSMDVAVIPKYYLKYAELTVPDAVLLITGRLDSQDSDAKLVANEIKSVDMSRLTMGKLPVKLKLPCKFMTNERLANLKSILLDHKGTTPVNLIIDRRTWRLPADYWVSLDSDLYAELRVNFGDSVISA